MTMLVIKTEYRLDQLMISEVSIRLRSILYLELFVKDITWPCTTFLDEGFESLLVVPDRTYTPFD